MTQRIPGLTYTEDILNEAKANRSRHLYVGNIGSKITENELTECLCKYGKVCDCSIFKKDGISYAVVGMLNVPEATKVMQSQACLKDRKLRFRYKHYDSCVPDELLPLEPESDTDDQISEKKEEKIYRTLIETTQLAQAFPIKNIVEKREENVTPNVDTFFRAQGKTHAPQINILDSIEETNHLRLREKLYFEATRFGSVLAIYITPTMISLIFKDEISAIDALKGFFTLSMLGRTQPFEKVELLRKKIENIVPAIKEMTDLSLENICTIQKDGISRTLFIGNIDPTVTEADIKDAFSAFGEIWQIDGKLQTGSLSSYAFVYFADVRSSTRVLKLGALEVSKIIEDDRFKNVDYAYGRSYPAKVVWLGAIAKETTSRMIADLSNVDEINIFVDTAERRALIFLSDFNEALACADRLKGKRLADKEFDVDFAPFPYLQHFFGHLLKEDQPITKDAFDEFFPLGSKRPGDRDDEVNRNVVSPTKKIKT